MNDVDETMTGAGATRRAMLRGAAALPLLAVSGCAFFDNLFNNSKKKLPGTREDVLPVSEGLAAPHGRRPAVVLPPPVAGDWPMEGGTPAHAGGNPALADDFKPVWTAHIGAGSAYRRQVTATPVVVGDVVFTMDSAGTVCAFAASDGTRLWRRETRPKKSRTTDIGGGIAFGDGTLYASTGYSQVLALDPKTGTPRWVHSIEAPIRSAPLPVGGMVYVITIDQILIGLSATDGRQLFTYLATPTNTTMLGQPAPAYAQGIVVAGFGSGDLVALRGDSGAVAWTDSIAAATGQAGVAQIAAIVGAPVIVGDLAIAIGTGGLMVGVDLRAGRRLWEREVSGHFSPLAAGGFVFVTTQDQQVAALEAATGEVAWLSTLPLYLRPKTKGAPITWTSWAMADGRLIFTGLRQRLAILDATTGDLVRMEKTPGPITVTPVVAHDTLYLITDDGILRAYR